MAAAAVGSFVAGKLGGWVGEQLAPILSKLGNWMPFKKQVVDFLIKQALNMVGSKPGGWFTEKTLTQDKVGLSLRVAVCLRHTALTSCVGCVCVCRTRQVKNAIEAVVEAKWAAIRKRIDPTDNGPEDRPPQTGC